MTDTSFNITILKFDSIHIQLDTTLTEYSMYFTNTSISDPITGELQFYTNGISIKDRTHHIMENGDSINYGTNTWNSYKVAGYRAVWGAVALPYPAHPNQYYLLHQRLVSGVPVFANLPLDFMFTEIDMRSNSGNGRVLRKNQSLLHDSLTNGIGVTKHANGRDWWVVQQNMRQQKFYFYLLDPTGIHLHHIQYIGGVNYQTQGAEGGFFSPDGSRFAYFDAYTGIYVYDFDRCNATLSNRKFIPYDLNTSAASGFCSIVFSPNSNLLYFSQYYHLSQYDLNAPDIAASKDTVATYDGFISPPSTKTTMLFMQLAPNGKIYIAPFSTTRYLHVIESPDVRGIGCNVLQHAIHLPALNNGTIPNNPNYRLGAWAGSGCDTLTVGTTASPANEVGQFLRTFPNPTTGTTRLVWSEPLQENTTIEITNGIGQIVQTINLPSGFTYQDIDIKTLPQGIYFVTLRSKTLYNSIKLVKIE